MDKSYIERLYEEYGRLMIQLELIQSRSNEVKKLIANELNKQKEEQKVGPKQDN